MVRVYENPILVNRLASKIKQIENYKTRWSRFGTTEGKTDPRRDYSKELGYPATPDIGLRDLEEMYKRNPIAKKVVDLLPTHCWKMHPSVVEDEDPMVETPFEIAFAELGKNLKGDSWYKNTEGNPIWEYLYRADRLAGIGHYGIILIGLANDDSPLSEPLDMSAKGDKELLYLKVFPEHLAQVATYENDNTNERYGQPTSYTLTFDSLDDLSSDIVSAPSVQVAEMVHWSRVIHIADNIVSNELIGTPRMLPVFDNLQDIKYKLYGASAEMYYLGALPGLSFETHPQLGGDVDIDVSTMQSQIELYMNGLQRQLVTTGMSAKSLAPQVVDPTPQIEAQIEAICIVLDCPKRIFMGSERGQLASGQDKQEWNEVVEGRREHFCTPSLVVPLVNRFIQLGVLPVPNDGFNVLWPGIETMSPLDRADIALKLTQAIAAYVAGDAVGIMPVESYLKSVLGFSQEESVEIMETLAEDGMEEALKDSLLNPEPEPMFGEPNIPNDKNKGKTPKPPKE